VRRLLFPLVVTAMFAYALATPSLDFARALGLPEAANAGLRPFSAIVLFYALIAWLERALPHRREWNRAHGDVGADTLHLLLTGAAAQGLYGALLLGPLTLLGGWLSTAAGAPFWPTQAPLFAQLVLALVLAELGHYLFHRLSHENPRVWRLHAAHHSAPRLYWVNATRFHVLDLFLIISCESVPLALLGAGQEVLGPYFAFRAVYGQVQHCNVDMPTPRWLDRIFSTPGVHRWHHSTISREGNTNYGAVLCCWDHVFRSFFRPDAPFAGPVGIGQLPDFPSSYLGQQLSPFRWWAFAGARSAPRAAGESSAGAGAR
jgi:sterol desaturase/sphingolipid hydroxylase (fatty acid hydroxylase superfamily)